MSEDRVPYAAGPEATPRRLIPVFQMDREALRRAVREILFDLHEDRQRNTALGAADRRSRIALWEGVLGWVMEQEGERINLVGPPR